ncbi:MAG: hypothetical protein HYR63_01890 [Proteobacteria bacterium]|nr:hypothetical protein [Pseudomonadota bacterium]
MIHDIADWSGMMWGMALPMILLLVVLVLAIAALIKYLFFSPVPKS